MKKWIIATLILCVAVMLVACGKEKAPADQPKLTLTLNEGDRVSIPAGQDFKDPGCTATDKNGTDLSKRVLRSGWEKIDKYQPGEYVITYKVTDDFGNTLTAERTVVVERLVQGDEITDKIVYLTFDDGPSKNTGRVLDVLKACNVKATYFAIGTSSLSELKRIADEGHTVGVHTYSHTADVVYKSEKAFFEDMDKLQEYVKQYTGSTTKYMRFPFGSTNNRAPSGMMAKLRTSVAKKGYTYFDWDVSASDSGGESKTADDVFYRVTEGIENCKKDKMVVLMHDPVDFSMDALERIIQWGLANGYTFLPIDENAPVCQF